MFVYESPAGEWWQIQAAMSKRVHVVKQTHSESVGAFCVMKSMHFSEVVTSESALICRIGKDG